MDEMLTIFPYEFRFITGTTACVNRKVPVRLKCRSCCHSASVRSSTEAAGLPMIVEPPTALTRMSMRSEEHTSELQSRRDLVCRLLLEKKKKKQEQKDRERTKS